MRNQVARSKGTEWMVSSYIAWQQHSPLAEIPQRNPSLKLKVVSRLMPSERTLNKAVSYSFRSLLTIIGIIISVKVR